MTAYRRMQLPDAAHGNWGAAVLESGTNICTQMSYCNYETAQMVMLVAHHNALGLQVDKLVHEVHDVLGRQRDGSARLGPATDEAPLLGGLRIGKADPEGTPDGDGASLVGSHALCCTHDIAGGHLSCGCCYKF